MRYFFMADAHLGSLLFDNPTTNEQKVIDWLTMASDEIAAQTDVTERGAIILVGDIFDFWFEFRNRVPEGHERVLDAIKHIVDKGIDVHFFCGNHDQWTYGYLERRCGMKIHKTGGRMVLGGKNFHIAHGHGLGEKRRAARFINRIFESRATQWMFRNLIPPSAGLAFGRKWSAKNRMKHNKHDSEKDNAIDYYQPHGSDSDAFQVQWAKEFIANEGRDVDYIVMGHLHHEINMRLSERQQLLIIDEFYNRFGYGVFDGNHLYAESFLER